MRRFYGKPVRFILVISTLLLFSASALAWTFDYVSRTSNGDPATVCYVDWPTEQAAVAVNDGTGLLISGTMNSGLMNKTSGSWNSWGTSWTGLNFASPVTANIGDGWADMSGNNIYVSEISQTASGSCLGVASTSESYLKANGTFQYPAQCVSLPFTKGDDRPAIAVSGAWSKFYGTSKKLSTNAFYSSNTCTVPGPVGCCVSGSCSGTCTNGGSVTCAITNYLSDMNTAFGTTFNQGYSERAVDINPCTGHAIVVHPGNPQANGTYSMYMTALTGTSTLVGQYAMESGVFHHDQIGCGMAPNGNGQILGCNGANCDLGCDDTFFRAVPRVKQRSDGKCYLYYAYDYATLVSGQYYYKTRMAIWDLGTSSSPKEGSSGANPTLVKEWQSTSDSFTWDQWKPELIVSDYSDAVGWFWYSDIHNSCNALFEGAHDSSGGIANMSATGQISDYFPIQDYTGKGLGEYQTGTKDGSPDGYLYPIWTQPVATSASGCSDCTATTPGGTTRYNWSMTAQTTQVTP